MDGNRIKITKQAVENLTAPETGQAIYRDTKLTGFGVRLTRGSKTYIVEGRISGRDQTCRVTIGKHGKIDADMARTQAKKILSDMAQGTNPNQEKRAGREGDRKAREKAKTIGDLWDEYKTVRRLGEKTIYDNSRILDRCFSDWLSRQASSITMDEVIERYKDLSNRVGPRSNSTGAHAQADRAMRILNSLMNYARKRYGDEIISLNPIDQAFTIMPRNRKVIRQTLVEDHQLKAWYEGIQLCSAEVRDYFLVCLLSGLRRNEALKLQWSELDLDRRTLTLPAERTKTKEILSLPLSDWLYEILKMRYEARDTSCPYVFPGLDGKNHLTEPKRQLKKAIEASGIKFSSHDLRRTFETITESLAISHYTQKRLINHKQSSDVTSRYIVITVEQLREPMQMVTDHVKAKVGLS